MNILKLTTKNSAHSTVHLGYTEKYMEETVNTKFLGLQIDNHKKTEAQIWGNDSYMKCSMLCHWVDGPNQ